MKLESLKNDKFESFKENEISNKAVVDDKKKEYETEYGFELFSGFWNCR